MKAQLSDNTSADGSVRVIERVVQLLESLSGGAASLNALSHQCGLAMSTTARLLASMQSTGLVERDAASKRYELGRMLFRLATNNKPRKDILSAAHPVLEALAERTGEDALLAELQGSTATFIDHVEGPSPLKIVGVVGQPGPLHYGAFRKILLAYQDPEWVADYLKQIKFQKLTRNTLGSAAAVLKELRKIRKQGYATSFGEWMDDAGGIAAPVFDYTGNVRAAIHIMGPIFRLNAKTADRYIPKVVEAAQQLSTAIGGPRQAPPAPANNDEIQPKGRAKKRRSSTNAA